MIEGEIKIKAEIPLQCPRCGQFLERLEEKYVCLRGHVELNTTHEGYIILKQMDNQSTSLATGGEFKEGAIWNKVINRCRKVVYVTSPEDKEDDLKPLRDFLASSANEFRVVTLNQLPQFKLDHHTLILFSYRIGKKNALKIKLKYMGHSVYGYLPGAVIGIRMTKLVQSVFDALIYKALAPITKRQVEAHYERYLSDKGTAEHFARTYLPRELQREKNHLAFDIGCGRGRHSAMLSQLGFYVIGIDLQPHPYWSRISNANLLVGSAECLSYFPDNTFDLILCMQVLTYLKDDDAALVHIRRMLKRGGYFLLQVLNKENLHTLLTNEPLVWEPYLQRYYAQTEMCGKLEKHGFIIDRIWTEKLYTPFFVTVGNILYDFILNRSLRTYWDRLVPFRYLGMINILARAN